MLKFENNTTELFDNTIVINEVKEYKLSDEEATKVISIIEGLIATRGSEKSTVSNGTVHTEIATPEKSAKKPSKSFPTLEDTAKEVIGYVTVYPTLKLVRNWEAKYTPDTVRYGIKQSLIAAGAKWDKTNGAYAFESTEALNKWVEAQRNRK